MSQPPFSTQIPAASKLVSPVLRKQHLKPPKKQNKGKNQKPKQRRTSIPFYKDFNHLLQQCVKRKESLTDGPIHKRENFDSLGVRDVESETSHKLQPKE